MLHMVLYKGILDSSCTGKTPVGLGDILNIVHCVGARGMTLSAQRL